MKLKTVLLVVFAVAAVAEPIIFNAVYKRACPSMPLGTVIINRPGTNQIIITNENK